MNSVHSSLGVAKSSNLFESTSKKCKNDKLKLLLNKTCCKNHYHDNHFNSLNTPISLSNKNPVSPDVGRSVSVESSNSSTSNQVMNRLSFENIDLYNTPLSSSKSCSEFNEPDMKNESNVRGNNSKKSRKSLWSKLSILRWSYSKKESYSKKNDNNDSFISDSHRINQISLFEGEEYSPSRSSSRSTVGRSKSRSKFLSSDSFDSFIDHEHHNSSIFDSYLLKGTDDSLDYMFGFQSRQRRLPMEIELKDLKDSNTLLSLDDNRDNFNNVRGLLHGNGSDSNIIRRVASLRSLEYINNAAFNANIHNINEIVNSVEIEFNIYSVTSWISKFNVISDLIVGKLRSMYPLGRDDEAFYESIRIQPFTSGSYLRAMLVSGFSSFSFNVYNLISWPEFTKEIVTNMSTFHQYTLNCLYIGLFIQILLNLIQLPFRLKIHYQCWESSRAVEVDTAVVTLRNMLLSDYWLISKAIGHLLDIILSVSTLFAEAYLCLCGSDDPLRSLIITLCSTSLLALVVRIIVATIFSLSMHDPQVLSDARKRGLSKWDLDVLPAFVFSNLDEVNNLDSCSICLGNFSIGELLISLPCDKKHSFHAGCIRQWLKRQNSCPLCQKLV